MPDLQLCNRAMISFAEMLIRPEVSITQLNYHFATLHYSCEL